MVDHQLPVERYRTAGNNNADTGQLTVDELSKPAQRNVKLAARELQFINRVEKKSCSVGLGTFPISKPVQLVAREDVVNWRHRKD